MNTLAACLIIMAGELSEIHFALSLLNSPLSASFVNCQLTIDKLALDIEAYTGRGKLLQDDACLLFAGLGFPDIAGIFGDSAITGKLTDFSDV